MKGAYLGEFEELVLLLVAVMNEDAYGLAIKEHFESHTGRSAAIGAIHSALNRLEEKGFVDSTLAEGKMVRGGRRKRIFSVTSSGKLALESSRELRNGLWNKIPELSWKGLSTILQWC